MPKQTIKISIPSGFIAESIVREESLPLQIGTAQDVWYRVRLVPQQRWRPATKQDVIDSLTGCKRLEARFRNGDGQDWKDKGSLVGYLEQKRYCWIAELGCGSWEQCEVREVE